MTNVKLAELFVELADILELANEKPTQLQSYRNIAARIRLTKKQLNYMTDEEIQRLPGATRGIVEKIKYALENGTFPALESRRASRHGEFYKIAKGIGITPLRFRDLLTKINVKSLDELKIALKVVPDNSYNKIDTDMLNKIAVYIGARK